MQGDIVNKSIFDLAYEEDRPSLYNLLQNPGSATHIMNTTPGKGMNKFITKKPAKFESIFFIIFLFYSVLLL